MDPVSGSTSPFLNTRQAAAHLRLKPSTLDHWRSVGGGPVFHKLGSRIYYTRDDLEAWVQSRRRLTTAEHRATRSDDQQPGRD
jgi:predicted DNA-binding transcriptional regulator AlpA